MGSPHIERNLRILEARKQGKTLREIGRDFGLSQERVRQITVILYRKHLESTFPEITEAANKIYREGSRVRSMRVGRAVMEKLHQEMTEWNFACTVYSKSCVYLWGALVTEDGTIPETRVVLSFWPDRTESFDIAREALGE